MDEITEQAVRDLLKHGVEFDNMRRIINRRLYAVGANLLGAGNGKWMLATNLPSTKKEDTITFDTFSQAFDAALTLLIERSGRVHSTVTPAEEVAKQMRNE